MTVRPRALVYRGIVSAAAFLLRVDHLGEAEARRRILSLWVPGSEVYRLGPDLLLRLPEPRNVHCDLAPGLPLLPVPDHPGIVSAAPLTAVEAEGLELLAEGVVLVSGGAARLEPRTRVQIVDPATWFELEEWACLPVTSLGVRAAAVQEAVEPITFDSRSRLAGVPPHPELAQVMAALRGEGSPGEGAGPAAWLQDAGLRLLGVVAAGFALLGQLFRPQPSGQADDTAPPQAPAGNSIPILFTPLLWLFAAGAVLGSAVSNLLRGLVSGSSDVSERGTRQVPAGPPDAWEGSAWEALRRFRTWLTRHFKSGETSSPGQEPIGPPPPPKRSAWEAMRQFAARLAMRSQLGRLLTRRQEQYVARMLELFERGELTEALRHAIPLGGPGSANPAPALGVPTARNDLSLHPRLFASGYALHAATDLFEHLQRLYRSAFERLRDQGRIDEAAFVLAELLHENEEAVAFLERHDKLRLAAEMAEGRDLPAGLVVRQWWLAGERERAVLIARRNHAWGDALIRLEQSNPEQAQQLRVMWGGVLAASGDFAQAVTVVWPVEEARRLALGWIDQVIAQGGVPAVQAVIRKLSLVPESAREVRAAVAAVLAQEGPEGAWLRRALAEALRTGNKSPQARTLARATARGLARDLATGDGPSTPEEIKKLVSFSADGALRTDLPSLVEPTRASLRDRTVPLSYRFEAGDGGVYPVLDAAYLSNGRCVIALGEAGVRLLSREGKTVAHFDQPAHRLVVSDHEDRVIAMAERGLVYRLAQIDLTARTVRTWCEAELTAFAETFDGSTWLIGTGKDFVSLDAMSTRLESLWRTRDVGCVTAISRRRDHASLLLRKAGNADGLQPDKAGEVDWERWNYELPSLVLRHRQPLSGTPDDYADRHCAVSATGTVVHLHRVAPDDPDSVELKLVIEGLAVTLDGNVPLILEAPQPDEQPLGVALSDEWITATRVTDAGVTCWIATMEKRRIRARVQLDGAKAARIRIHPEHITLCDDRGRVIALELGQGRLLRDLRSR